MNIQQPFDFRSVYIGNDHLNYIQNSSIVYKLVKKGGCVNNFPLQEVFDYLEKIETSPLNHIHIHVGENEIREDTNPDALAKSILELSRSIIESGHCKVITIGGLICQTKPTNLSHDVEKFNKIVKGVNKRLSAFCKVNPYFGFVFLSSSHSDLCDGIHLTDENYAEYSDRIWNIAWDIFGKVSQ